MSDLRELYQSLILDHGRKPRNFSVLSEANKIKEGFNPLCGDQITLYLDVQDEIVINMAFQGCGCAISVASSSLMIDHLKGKSINEIKKIFAEFHIMVTGKEQMGDFQHLGKLEALKGVAEFPARVKCATLAWHTLIAALENNPEPITTE
jgi:nitrogen fixation protein NifU and related proteins